MGAARLSVSNQMSKMIVLCEDINMASSPKVDGGMTEEQYKRLQMDERKFQAELEERKFNRAQDAEAKRLEQEKANEERLESIKNAEERAIDQAEMNLSQEIDAQAQAKKDDDDDNMGAIDFYGSLSKGQELSSRPE